MDRSRVACGGHSYGAFMAANLLAHAGDLFACGIAQSGAYNRTLTPFGFQSEQRTLWEAPDTYITMSPFLQVWRIHLILCRDWRHICPRFPSDVCKINLPVILLPQTRDAMFCRRIRSGNRSYWSTVQTTTIQAPSQCSRRGCTPRSRATEQSHGLSSCRGRAMDTGWFKCQLRDGL